MNHVEHITENFKRFVPKGSAPLLADFVVKYKVNVIVKPSRKTKRGDFRAANRSRAHQITINADLSPYEFLITMVHEMAHLLVWEQYKDTVKPHGLEWQTTFKEIMQPYLAKKVFPPTIETALIEYLDKPKATTCNDYTLLKVLKTEKSSTDQLHVEDVTQQEAFQLKNDTRWFLKVKKLRKNYLCQQVSSERFYRISPLAEVVKTKSL